MIAQIKKIFQTNVELLGIVDKAVLYFREQEYQAALEYMPEVSAKMRHVIDGIIGDKEYFELVSTDSLMRCWRALWKQAGVRIMYFWQICWSFS